MSISASTRLFFDASCLIAAAASPNGGSGFILSICESGELTAVISWPVLAETEANLLKKFPEAMLLRHRLQIAKLMPAIALVPRLDVSPRRCLAINPKDEHVVVAAVASSSHFILTLDQPLAREINEANLGLGAFSPGAFITTLLPTHPAFVERQSPFPTK